MEYQNYFIEYKQNDSNLFVKFTDKNSKISYENIITLEQIDNLPISKFIKILENSINSISNYKIIIELSNDELTLNLNYDTEILNLSYRIILEKISSIQTIDNLLKRIEKLENIIDGNNQITIAKNFKIETKNDNMTKLTTNYINLPDDSDIDTISNRSDSIYEIQNIVFKREQFYIGVAVYLCINFCFMIYFLNICF
jgi:hypothetical protein